MVFVDVFLFFVGFLVFVDFFLLFVWFLWCLLILFGILLGFCGVC